MGQSAMLETDLLVKNAILEDRVHELEAKLEACNLILANNAKELPEFVAKLCHHIKATST